MTGFFDQTERQLVTAARRGRHLPRRDRFTRPRIRPVLAAAGGALILAGSTATAASLLGSDPPRPGAGGAEVSGETGYAVYWSHGVVSRIVDCERTSQAEECRGDRAQQLATNQRILDAQTPSGGVLFLTADGGLLSCAGAVACSYMQHEPNFGRDLPPVGTRAPERFRGTP